MLRNLRITYSGTMYLPNGSGGTIADPFGPWKGCARFNPRTGTYQAYLGTDKPGQCCPTLLEAVISAAEVALTCPAHIATVEVEA